MRRTEAIRFADLDPEREERAVEQLLETPEQAAKVLQISRSTLFALLASGEVKSVKIGRNRRIPHDALVEYVQRLRAEQSGGTAA